jgi:iron complex outermembrane recepter protein
MKPRIRRLHLGAAVLCALHAVFVRAGDAGPDAGDAPVVLPPVRVLERREDTHDELHGVSVISARDIERSAAANVSELLAREANVNLQSFYGSDKKAALDIRGMGEAAGSNVVIMVDGVRLNELDLSGADLSGLDLSQIERIRVVRGGGAVRVGDGAVGGVIDITTRRAPAGALSGAVDAQAGSYGMRKLNVYANGRGGPWSLRLRAGRSDSDGYRDNSYLYSRDGSLELEFAPTGRVSAFVRVTRHFDEYGMPGGLPASVLSASGSARRASLTPRDGGRTDDSGYVAGASADFGAFGVTSVQASARRRDNPFIFCDDTKGCPESPIRSARDALQIDHHVELPSTGSRAHVFGFGLNSWNGDYTRFEGEEYAVGNRRISGDVHSHGGYADMALRLGEGVTLKAGARIDRFRSTRLTETLSLPSVPIPDRPFSMPCASCPPYYAEAAAPSRGSWRNHARELGLSWDATTALNVFASTSRHFRSPNIDELALASTDLRPQRGRTTEAGARLRTSVGAEFSLTIFRIRIEDEIHFGPEQIGAGQSANRNYPVPTLRTGAEFQSRWPLSRSLGGVLNLGYVRPRLSGVDGDIPSVPRRTVSARLEWQALERVQATLAARYVSGVRDGNAFDDPAPSPPLASFTVVDAGLRWRGDALAVSASVNNLFNRIYATRQYSGQLYPMPERHFALGLNWRF